MANKTAPTDVNPEDFIDSVPDAQKQADARWLIACMQEITGAPAVMWGPSIIGFGTHHYVYESGREGDWMITGFSPRKSALSIYIMSGLTREAELLARLGKHRTGKSCLYIKRLSDVDTGVLKELISSSVKKITG